MPPLRLLLSRALPSSPPPHLLHHHLQQPTSPASRLPSSQYHTIVAASGNNALQLQLYQHRPNVTTCARVTYAWRVAFRCACVAQHLSLHWRCIPHLRAHAQHAAPAGCAAWACYSAARRAATFHRHAAKTPLRTPLLRAHNALTLLPASHFCCAWRLLSTTTPWRIAQRVSCATKT